MSDEKVLETPVNPELSPTPDHTYDASKLSKLEVLDNSVDEYLAGFCNRIDVTIHVDGSISIRDNGRGIPVDIHKEYGIPGVELVLTTLHSGGKYGQGGYTYSGGTHGVGAKCVN